jgi:hypothetical protein
VAIEQGDAEVMWDRTSRRYALRSIPE